MYRIGAPELWPPSEPLRSTAGDGGIVPDPDAPTHRPTDAETGAPVPSDGDAASADSGMSSQAISLVFLNLVAVIWGTQHAVIKMVVDDGSGIDAADFSLARFAVAAVVAAVATPDLRGLGEWLGRGNKEDGALPSEEIMSPAATSWRYGSELGAYMFAGYAAQAIGLAYTTAQRSGFLLYLNVKLVPFLAFLTLGRRISLPTWASAAAALVGTTLLGYDGSMGPNIGDLWSIAAAFASAVFILRMETASRNVPDSAALNSACLWTVTVLSLLWTLSVHAASGSPVESVTAAYDGVSRALTLHPWEVIYLGAVSTALANWMQAKGQQGVAAERASVVYAMDPVYGAGFAYLLLGETMGVRGAIGASIIAIAAATNAFLDLGAKEEDVNDDSLEILATSSDREEEGVNDVLAINNNSIESVEKI